jgi:hypothetical protein
MKIVSTTVEKIKNTFVCEFCGKEFGRKKDCESHEDTCSERAVVLTREVNRLTEGYVGHYIVSINRYHEDDYVMRVTIPKSFEIMTDEFRPVNSRLVVKETYDEYAVRMYNGHFCDQNIKLDERCILYYRGSESSYDFANGMIVLKDRAELEFYFSLFVGLYNMDQDDVRDKHVQDIRDTLVYYYNKYKVGE